MSLCMSTSNFLLNKYFVLIMANTNREFAVALRALRNRGCHVSQEWLRDCIDFFRSENNQYTPKDLENFVYDQWTLGDLQNVAGSGSFPPNLSDNLKTSLEGRMACQVQFVTDIGHSSYTQMQKLRNEDVGNLNVDEVGKEFQQAWEPKSNRMLYLTLFDGAQTLKAIEYRPIPTLKTSMIPGTKILIQGPIICRRGILMLEERHLTILGGEVDALVITNAYENVLARKLNLPENPDPYNLAAVGNGLPSVPLQNPQNTQGNAQQPAIQPPQQIMQQPVRQPSLQSIQQPLREPQQRNIQQPSRQQPSRQQPQQNKQQPARQHPQHQQNKANQSGGNTQFSTAAALEMPNKKMVQPTLSWSKQGQQTHKKDTTPQNQPIDFCGDDEDFLNIPLNDWDTEMEYGNGPTRNEPHSTNAFTRTETSTMEFEMGSDEEAALLEAEASLASNAPVLTSMPREETTVPLPSIGRRSVEETSTCKRPASSVLPEESLRKPLFAKRRKESSSQEVSSTSDLSFLLGDDLLDFEESSSGTSNVLGNPGPITLSSNPFVYLSHIIKYGRETSKSYRIKAAVITVINKLSIVGGEWKLSAKISDGSANMDVQFSAKVLEELIGMSAKTMTEMKKEMVLQPEKKEIVRKKFEQAQIRLINLNCLLDIQFCEDEDLPIVVELNNISAGTVAALKSRRSLL